MVPWAFVTLTVASGMVDAVSYLRLGHVFVANMTGNVVFIGFALAGDHTISVAGSLTAMGAFLLGAFAGGRLVQRISDDVKLLLTATVIELALALAALGFVTAMTVQPRTVPAYAVTALVALAIGTQIAAVRKIAIPDFTTTVLTMTLAGIAADVSGSPDARLARRLTSVVSMFGGALAGAAIVLRGGLVPAFALIALMFAITVGIVVATGRARTAPSP
jgi:uncharacterized membrane protein YoaK (UPF0700 family)